MVSGGDSNKHTRHFFNYYYSSKLNNLSFDNVPQFCMENAVILISARCMAAGGRKRKKEPV